MKTTRQRIRSIKDSNARRVSYPTARSCEDVREPLLCNTGHPGLAHRGGGKRRVEDVIDSVEDLLKDGHAAEVIELTEYALGNSSSRDM
jgi:hypothetical protein